NPPSLCEAARTRARQSCSSLTLAQSERGAQRATDRNSAPADFRAGLTKRAAKYAISRAVLCAGVRRRCSAADKDSRSHAHEAANRNWCVGLACSLGGRRGVTASIRISLPSLPCIARHF